MKAHRTSIFSASGLRACAAASLFSFISITASANNEADQMKAMENAAERVLQGAKSFEENLKRIREERKRAEEERKQEAAVKADMAKKDAAAPATAKNNGGKTLQKTQEKARLEAQAKAEQAKAEQAKAEQAKAEQAERERQAALAEQAAKEAKLAQAKAALEKANTQKSLSGDVGGATQQAKSTPPTQQPQQAAKLEIDPDCLDNPDPQCGSGFRLNASAKR